MPFYHPYNADRTGPSVPSSFPKILLKVILGLILLGIIFGSFKSHKTAVQPSGTAVSHSRTTLLKRLFSPTYHVVLGGDIMLSRRTELNVHQDGQDDYGFPWEYVAPILRKADISFVNHEGAASDRGEGRDKQYIFRFKPAAEQGLAYAGIDVVSLANNHIMDWGYDALCDTVKNVQAVGVDTVGAGCDLEQASTPAIKTLPDGTRVAFLAMTPFSQWAEATADHPGLSPFGAAWATSIAKNLKDSGQADLVFVSVHMGTEHQFHHNSDQEKLYHALIDGGVDVVIGVHPHVPQEIEHYGDGWIMYSLGNLIFDMHDALPDTYHQIMADVNIRGGVVTDVQTIPIHMNDLFQPVPDK